MNFHDFTVKAINGSSFDMAQLKGKKVLVVNTASECGFTPQYQQLQKLYETFGPEKFTVIGFPVNDFGAQEPGSDADIHAFCQANYGVSFPMMSKITVKGAQMHPLYQWLTSAAQNGRKDVEIQWNFQKFMIAENGSWAGSLASNVGPASATITNWIQG